MHVYKNRIATLDDLRPALANIIEWCREILKFNGEDDYHVGVRDGLESLYEALYHEKP